MRQVFFLSFSDRRPTIRLETDAACGRAAQPGSRSTAREERGGCAAGSGARWRVFGGRW